MTPRRDPPSSSNAPGSRETRLREALRANLQRRKAQARARAAGEDATDVPGATGTESDNNSPDKGEN